jgi:hypothetical protein
MLDAYYWHSIDPLLAATERLDTLDLPEEHQLLLLNMLHSYHRRWVHQRWNVKCKPESVFTCRTPTPSGNPSSSYRLGITTDLLIDDPLGQTWIVEHKTTGSSLARWLQRNGHRPQATTYAIVLAQNGIKVTGVIYNLSLQAAEPQPEQYKVTKDGKRLYRKLPANTTHDTLMNALMHHGLNPSEQQYREQLAELQLQPNPFHQRYTIRFDDLDIARSELELHRVCRKVSASRRKAWQLWMIADGRCRTIGYTRDDRQPIDDRHLVDGALAFTRNPNSCYLFRECSYRNVCRYLSCDALEGLEYNPRDQYADVATKFTKRGVTR